LLQREVNCGISAIQKERYVPASVTQVPFHDDTFDLALCSHFLLLYSLQLDYDFQFTSFQEMKRVVREVRVFPLLDLDANRSDPLPPLMNALENLGHTARLETVSYEFIKGADLMLIF